MWILLIVWVIQGDLDLSYRPQPTQEICEIRRDTAEKHITIYGRNIEHFKATCIKLNIGEE